MLKKKKLISVCLSFALAVQAGSFLAPGMAASAAEAEQFQVSPGVKYKENREVINSYNQSIKFLEVNMADPYTKLDLSIPLPLNTISTVSAQAKLNHREGNRVVGAVYGSFFDMSTKLPMYLISYRNKVMNTGIIATGSDQYVNKPVAFGINSQGKPQIESFNLSMSAVHNNRTVNITSMNKIRNYDDLILFTPEYTNGYTNTNQYGMEVVFSNASKNRDLEFGDVITGTVSQIRAHGDITNTKIPEDGFVLSAHGTSLPALKEMKPGDTVEIAINIDDKWKNSEYMLASGPLLVNNGKVDLGMDPNSTRARERAPRTAVAIDKTMSKVFLVTVDGRLAESKGMNLTEFAQYLVKLGAYKALNLDGGGSTAIIARKNGNDLATLMNKPSDGRERAVSTSLQAISTAPLSEPKFLNAALSASGEIVKGSSLAVNITSVLDQFYNPLPKDPSKLKLSSTIGEVSGNIVKATTAGTGVITASYGNAVKQIPITVVEELAKFSDVGYSSPYFDSVAFLTDGRIINGYNDGTFRPGASLTRLDAALLIARALKLDTANAPYAGFADVPKEYRYAKEISAVAAAGVIKGKEGNLFDPNANLTRAEMAVILQRAFKLTGNAPIRFSDMPPSSFAYEAVGSLIANKVTEGFKDNTFRPGDTVNRGQYALFLYRILSR